MKVNRTFSIDLWLAKELLDKRNQSQFVCDAIKDKLDGIDSNLTGAGVKSLMIFLKGHPECDPFIKQALESSLRAAYEHAVSDKPSLSS
jgi:ribosomal 50S subunit-associated protein YjgA (DUF615 family)|tara:strand:+ start:468 stop:734 length:267 start_codon:yes stop_codon:yes gene_type:complete